MTNTNTKIEWTDTTWSPVTGCTKVSAGCKNCYAEGIADRFWATQYPPTVVDVDGAKIERPRRFTDVRVHPERLDEPLRWRKPRRVFVNSMSDLFHDAVPDEFIAAVFGVMAAARQHTFQVLTKRPERMLRWFKTAQSEPELGCSALAWCQHHAEEQLAAGGTPVCHLEGDGAPIPWPLPNVWLGVSCENQETADERIPYLVRTPAAVRFLSCEPLLGPIDLDLLHGCRGCNHPGNIMVSWNEHGRCSECDGTRHEPSGLHWVIAGGESGRGARPCDVAWIRSLVKQCRAARVACFVKQLGAGMSLHTEHGRGRHVFDRSTDEALVLRDGKGGDMAEWPEDLRVREFPR